MIVVPGPASTKLGEDIARLVPCTKVDVEHKVFPDGESYLRFAGDVKGEDVAIVQSTYRPQDTHVFQLISLANTARELGARRIVAVVPYLAYARQAERYREGEAVTSRTIARMFDMAGVSQVLTVDVHSQSILKVFRMRAEDISSARVVVDYVKRDTDAEAPVVVAPDKEREGRAKEAADLLGTEHMFLEKHRDRITGKVTTILDEASQAKVSKRDALIFDDIISTGDTMVNAIDILRKLGAKRVYVICTHPVLAEGALDRIRSCDLSELAATDTIPSPISKISVASLIAERLRGT